MLADRIKACGGRTMVWRAAQDEELTRDRKVKEAWINPERQGRIQASDNLPTTGKFEIDGLEMGDLSPLRPLRQAFTRPKICDGRLRPRIATENSFTTIIDPRGLGRGRSRQQTEPVSTIWT